MDLASLLGQQSLIDDMVKQTMNDKQQEAHHSSPFSFLNLCYFESDQSQFPHCLLPVSEVKSSF